MEPIHRLQLTGITKRYPGCVANAGVDLCVRPGEIHALLGENGAGKSTLMKIIYGVVKPDEGEIRFEGTPVQIQGPAHARGLGIGMVFQHFSLFETLSVVENIALGLPPEQAKDLANLSRRIETIGARYGMHLDPKRYVHSLSIGERQRVEILRCLLQDIKLLILDEPTSVLTPQEVDGLFQTLRQLASEGCSILFISHKLKEVQSLCHEATVLRGGRVSGHCQPAQTSTDTMARMMVGDDTPISANFPKVCGREAFLAVRQLSQRCEDPFGTSLKNISFEVRRGEILGIAGVAGNGQEELLTLLSGEALCHAEQIRFAEQPVGQLRADQRRALGLGFVPEERLGRGAVPDMSLRDNALLTGFLHGLVNKGWIRGHKVREFAEQIRAQFNVKCSGIGAQAKSLSGGNLQKFIIGREILQNPKLLICSHPTWGVDVGAAMLIHAALIALRDQGAAVLVVSEDIDELYQISDRIGALCDGRLSPIKPTAATPITELGSWMAGHFSSAEEVSTGALEARYA